MEVELYGCGLCARGFFGFSAKVSAFKHEAERRPRVFGGGQGSVEDPG